MMRDFTWEGVNRNLKVSVITPNGLSMTWSSR